MFVRRNNAQIKLKEWPANQLTIRNWIAIRGDIAGVEREHYDTKLAALRKTDPQVDWSNVSLREDSRRVIFYLDQDIADWSRPISLETYIVLYRFGPPSVIDSEHFESSVRNQPNFGLDR